MTNEDVRERYDILTKRIGDLATRLEKPDLSFDEIRGCVAQGMAFLYHIDYFKRFAVKSKVPISEYDGLVGQLYDQLSPINEKAERMHAEAEEFSGDLVATVEDPK